MLRPAMALKFVATGSVGMATPAAGVSGMGKIRQPVAQVVIGINQRRLRGVEMGPTRPAPSGGRDSPVDNPWP